MESKEKLEVISPAAFLQIPPEHTLLQRVCWDAGYLYCCHTCWYVAMPSGQRPESCFSSFRVLYSLVVKLPDPSVGIHPGPQPPCRFPVHPDEAIPNSYIGCLLQTQVLLVALAAGGECCIGFCSVKLQLPSIRPVNSHSGTGLEFSDKLVNIVPCCRPSHVIHKG